MKRVVKLTAEQFNRLMSEGITYDVDNAIENPRILSTAQQNNGNISIANVDNGSNSEEPATVTADVDDVRDTITQLKTQNLNADVVVNANGVEVGELQKAKSDAESAGAVTNESRFSKKRILEMNSKYLRENAKIYTKKDFLKRK